MNGRRKALTVLGTVPWTAAQAMGAQTRLLGALDPFPRGDPTDAGLRKWLRRFGYAEAETQRIIVRGSNGRDDLLPTLAAELVALRPDVILTWGDVAARTVQGATTSIPIVVMTDNLLGAGHVASLNRPAGNMTGVSVMATELDAKRLELLAPLLPPRSTVLLLADAVTSPLSRPGVIRTAHALGLQLTEAIVRTPQDIRDALKGARKRGIAGVNVLASPVLFGQIEEVIVGANAARLPAIFEWSFWADRGALIAYGPLLEPLYRRLLIQVMGLIRGGNVADFPVEQPTLFELAINLRTAKTIGVDIPQVLMLRADRVIH